MDSYRHYLQKDVDIDVYSISYVNQQPEWILLLKFRYFHNLIGERHFLIKILLWTEYVRIQILLLSMELHSQITLLISVYLPSNWCECSGSEWVCFLQFDLARLAL